MCELYFINDIMYTKYHKLYEKIINLEIIFNVMIII